MSMEPKDEAIREIKKLQKTKQEWFKVLTRYCEHSDQPLCQIPVSINPKPGVLICNLENCYLCNNKEV